MEKIQQNSSEPAQNAGASSAPASAVKATHDEPASESSTLESHSLESSATPDKPFSLITPPPEAVTASAPTTIETVGLPSGTSPLPDTSFTWGGYFQAIGILIILLVVLWYVLRLVRRFAGGTLVPSGALSRQDLRMEAQLAVGPRKGVVVVRFLNKRLLLGVTDQQITLLTETDVDSESPNGPDGPNGADGTDEKELASKFQRLLEQSVPGKAFARRRLFGAASAPDASARRS